MHAAGNDDLLLSPVSAWEELGRSGSERTALAGQGATRVLAPSPEGSL
jgi:hypothetical protein